jgi:hypothetical protein
MTSRFEAELAIRGRDWSDKDLAEHARAYMFEQISPDEKVVDSGIVSLDRRAEITRAFLEKDSKNVIVFYPLFTGDLPEIIFSGLHE